MSRGDRSWEGERTAEEREREREERARRRALRSGGAVPEHSAPEPPERAPSEPEPALLPPAELPPTELYEILPDASAPQPEPSVEEEPEPPAPNVVGAQVPAAEEPRLSEAEPGAPQHSPTPAGEPPGEPAAQRPPRAERALPSGRTAPPAIVLPGPKRSRRSPLARLAALVALLAVVAAVVLVVKALHGETKVKPPAQPVVVKVLIPEGKTRAQIAQIASAAGLKGSYRVASRRSSLLNPVHYGAPRGTPDLEGFLFPATYDMNPGKPASGLVEKQLSAFTENFGRLDIARAHALHVTPYQLLIVASMIEREAQVPGDRAKIAAVIYNRLHDGMPLGIDATIYYAVELEKGIATYTHELTESELHIDSPYNTRTHTGLPPTPISNPGVASIEAAAHPARAAYLYYVAGADGCGEQVFSTTQAAFEANAAAYQAAEQKNGGHPPVCKHR